MKCSQRDLVGGWWAVASWYVPTLLVLIGAMLPGLRATLWIPSFAIMGVACLINARGCGRLHCYVTGPLFLLAALATTLDALALVDVSWKLTFVAVGAGTLLAYCLEWMRGKYVGTSVP